MGGEIIILVWTALCWMFWGAVFLWGINPLFAAMYYSKIDKDNRLVQYITDLPEPSGFKMLVIYNIWFLVFLYRLFGGKNEFWKRET